MKELDVIEKLNKNNNFHLALKVIQISDDSIIDALKEDYVVIKQVEESYELLLKAYNEKKKVLVNENIKFLLPQIIIITKDVIDIIKPIIPVYYHLKDNKIIQKIKPCCHKKMTSFTQLKSEQEIIELIKTI